MDDSRLVSDKSSLDDPPGPFGLLPASPPPALGMCHRCWSPAGGWPPHPAPAAPLCRCWGDTQGVGERDAQPCPPHPRCHGRAVTVTSLTLALQTAASTIQGRRSRGGPWSSTPRWSPSPRRRRRRRMRTRLPTAARRHRLRRERGVKGPPRRAPRQQVRPRPPRDPRPTRAPNASRPFPQVTSPGGASPPLRRCASPCSTGTCQRPHGRPTAAPRPRLTALSPGGGGRCGSSAGTIAGRERPGTTGPAGRG